MNRSRRPRCLAYRRAGASISRASCAVVRSTRSRAAQRLTASTLRPSLSSDISSARESTESAFTSSSAKTGKLSYKEQRELDALPARIEALEAEQARIAAQLASADLYQREPQQVPVLQARHEAIEIELMEALETWERLGAR